MSLKRNPPSLPNDLNGLFIESRNCIGRYDFQGAIEMMQRARKLEPANDKIMVDLGSAYAQAYDFNEAQRWFEEAIHVSPTPVAAMNAAGHAWLEVRNFEAGLICFERILGQKDVPLVTLIRLSEIYTRLGRLEEAAQITETALRSYGTEDSALLARANVHRQMGQWDWAERGFRVLVARTNGDRSVRAMAWYGLAGLLDHQGDYDAAMKALLEAKTLLRQGAAKPLEVLRRKQGRLKEMQECASSKVVDQWRKSGATELQPARKLALLCGHARSGTTLLEYVIAAHPGVALAEETMVFHNQAYFPLGQAVSGNATFVSSLEWIPSRTLRQIRNEYFRGIESFLGTSIGERLLLDKNPANTFDVPAIARVFPENRFLAALRDPRDVCLSCFMQPVNILPDTAAWLTLQETIQHYNSIMGLWAAWKPCLGEQALEVRYEDMVENLENSARRVLEFLGQPWNENVLRFHKHAGSTIVRSPTFAEVTKPLYRTSVGRWKNYQKYFEPYLSKLAPLLKVFGYD